VYRSSGQDITNLMNGIVALFHLFKRMKFVVTIIIAKSIAISISQMAFVKCVLFDSLMAFSVRTAADSAVALCSV
jgi:hypothetical protein